MRPRTLLLPPPPPPPPPHARTVISLIIQSASTGKRGALMSEAWKAGQNPAEKRLMGVEKLRQEVQGKDSSWAESPSGVSTDCSNGAACRERGERREEGRRGGVSGE
ncbi:hypothetical protein Q5P01_003744 [Channa striata]|uniref:Uncharacterized protein n=1 Tax=Channa striata TaxID=64152 RepID=A0AA88T1M1_CHASR|nr:hypothetical protein Q5P01_003744 [Channa striata]